MRSLGATRLMAMGAVALALTGFFSFLIVRATTPQMVPLFTDLTVDDSASIIKDLERQAIPYALKKTWGRLNGIIACPTAAVGNPGEREMSQGCLLLRTTRLHRELAAAA